MRFYFLDLIHHPERLPQAIDEMKAQFRSANKVPSPPIPLRHEVKGPVSFKRTSRKSIIPVQKSRCGKFHRIGNEKRRRVYEYYWAHFAAEIHLSE